MPRKKESDGLRPKAIECEECGDIVKVSEYGKVPRYCEKHRDVKNRKPKTANGANAPAPDAGPVPADRMLARNGGGGRRKKGKRPTTANCEVCGKSIQFGAKGIVPRFCLEHRSAKHRPRPAGAVNAPTTRAGHGGASVTELARKALKFAGLKIERALSTSEGVMLLVRRQ